MKKILMTLFAFGMMTLQASAYNRVNFVISDGSDNAALKSTIESNVTFLLTELNRSQEDHLAVLRMPGDLLIPEALEGLNLLWKNEHLRCPEAVVKERLLNTRDGYQVRGIPLVVSTVDGSQDLGQQEAVISFDKRGIITSFYYTINPEIYSKLRMVEMSDSNNEVTDIADRMTILDYVEHFRTSYNQKDLRFLQQVFSDDALIITGRVIEQRRTDMHPAGYSIKYTKHTKKQYLQHLERVFRSNRRVKVTFEDVTIVKHPTIDAIYGVTVRQNWTSDRYHDEGYVFMVWDFTTPDQPQIHVRTWQPEYIDKKRDQKLNPNDVFTLGDFEYE